MARARARLLSRYDPAALEELGFFGRDRELLERLIVTPHAHASTDEDLRPLAESVLARIERVVPDLAVGAHSAREIGRLVERPRPEALVGARGHRGAPEHRARHRERDPVPPRGRRARAPRPVAAGLARDGRTGEDLDVDLSMTSRWG